MNAIEAIERLAALDNQLSRLLAAFREERRRAEVQWAGLGRVGAQREDHAASLLVGVRAVLAELAEAAEVAEDKVDQLILRPFEYV